MKVEILRRDYDGWQKETYTNSDVVNFSSIGLMISIEEIYNDVQEYI